MRVVAIPFLDEAPELVSRNVAIAAAHPAIDEVWAIHGEAHNPPWTADTGLPSSAIFIPEERLGTVRPGKGDAMNTAIRRAADLGVDRLHFYDADITNFNHDWISGAEHGADQGFEVVRHSFPRAATDAMITWMVTKPGFAMRYPGSLLPRIRQPLGGEILLTSKAVEAMSKEPSIVDRSDWGIDTLLTFGSVAGGFSIYEHQVSDGKRHSLYGSLEELRTMAVECLGAVSSLPPGEVPDVDHFAEALTPVPGDLREQPAYSMDTTERILVTPWGEGERDALEIVPGNLAGQIAAMVESGAGFEFLDEEAWFELMARFLAIDHSNLGDGPHLLFFRLWVGRVLHYSTHQVTLGYEHALGYLSDMIRQYEAEASLTQGR